MDQVQQYCYTSGKFDDGKDRDFLKEIIEFVSSDSCPMKVKVPLERVKQRVMTTSGAEPHVRTRIDTTLIFT